MLQGSDREDLEKELQKVWLVWVLMIGSLPAYLFLCLHLDARFHASTVEGPSAIMRGVFSGMSALSLVVAFFLRRRLPIARPETPYLVVVLFSLALSESVAVYGLLLFFMGGDLNTLYVFVGVSALAMVIFRPQIEEIEDLTLARKKKAAPPDSDG